MLVKVSIDKLISQNRELLNFIKKTSNKNADDAIVNYSHFLKQSNYNAALSVQFANLLQLSNDSSLYGQFELKDIESLFDSFLELNQYCSDIYIDAANFADTVMDDKQKANTEADPPPVAKMTTESKGKGKDRRI